MIEVYVQTNIQSGWRGEMGGDLCRGHCIFIRANSSVLMLKHSVINFDPLWFGFEVGGGERARFMQFQSNIFYAMKFTPVNDTYDFLRFSNLILLLQGMNTRVSSVFRFLKFEIFWYFYYLWTVTRYRINCSASKFTLFWKRIFLFYHRFSIESIFKLS